MHFALVGGDAASVLLGLLLSQDGHSVCCFGLEKAELPSYIYKAGCLHSCLYGADCVILPEPAEQNNCIRSSYSLLPLPVDELLENLYPRQLLVGGGMSKKLRHGAESLGLQVSEPGEQRRFALSRAVLEAQSRLDRAYRCAGLRKAEIYSLIDDKKL